MLAGKLTYHNGTVSLISLVFIDKLNADFQVRVESDALTHLKWLCTFQGYAPSVKEKTIKIFS